MKGINKVILIGHLGSDPDVRHLESGVAVANFNIATTESYKDKQGNWVDQTEWHRIVLWRDMAERAEKFLKKGDPIYLEGKLKTREWEKDGIKRYTTEIWGDLLRMLGGKKDQDSGNQSNNAVSEPEPPADLPEDDLPF